MPLENVTFTDEQRALCDEDDSCLYDLVMTGDESVAMMTKSSSENSTITQDSISK